MLVIESEESVEVYDTTNRVARVSSLIATINEQNLLDWYGTLMLDGRCNDIEQLSRLRGRILTLSFKCKNKGYHGLIALTSEPSDSGEQCRIDFRGVDLLYIVR
ncbi:MAG: hypothetical protein A4E28_02869 [Methanocella sp. PtaU1.Bin125]|nr:MAG: hypothetical protein A4E28_02869 [Methanocella sp. PtaU1.Bin125]